VRRQPSGIQYQDFDLLFEKKDGGYMARILESPAGTAVQVFSLPFTPLEFENIVLRLGMERRGLRREVRAGDPMDLNAARDIGSRLFNAVFQGAVGNRLFACLDETDEKKGLRIRLRLGDVPELMDAPWEYLYNSELKRFYALSIESPVVRYLDLPERDRCLPREAAFEHPGDLRPARSSAGRGSRVQPPGRSDDRPEGAGIGAIGPPGKPYIE
jgi:hypothetical protein